MTAGFHAKATGLGDFAVLTITGRSFLYHQILKMMGLVLAVAGKSPAESSCLVPPVKTGRVCVATLNELQRLLCRYCVMCSILTGVQQYPQEVWFLETTSR